MHFTVTSSTSADNDLAFLWVQAIDKNAVTRAANAIDKILRLSPFIHGLNPGQNHTITIDPLTAVFTVSPDDCQVTIWQYLFHL